MSAVSDLLQELTDYHNVTGDARAGALISVLYDANESAGTDEYKAAVKSRQEAEKAAAADKGSDK